MGECSSKLTFVKAISQVAPECKTDEHGVHQVSLGPLGTFQTVLSDVFFNILVGIMILFGPIWFAASLGHEHNSFALIMSLIVLGLVLIRLLLQRRTNVQAVVLNIIFGFAISFAVLPFYLAPSPVVKANHRERFDPELLTSDKSLLGWIYPMGQLSLALDRSEHLNPGTKFGRLYTDFLELIYISYYLVIFFPTLLILKRYVLSWWRGEGYEVLKQMSQVRIIFVGWLFAFIFIFTCNTILPAVSPRLFLAHEFIHPLEGFGLTKWLLQKATDNDGFGSFPSGHFAESMVAAIYTFQLNRKIGIALIVNSVFIGLATQVLRYHYFTDLIASAVVVVLSLWIGHAITPAIFEREVGRMMALKTARLMKEIANEEQNSTELPTISSSEDTSAASAEPDAIDLEVGPSPPPDIRKFVNILI